MRFRRISSTGVARAVPRGLPGAALAVAALVGLAACDPGAPSSAYPRDWPRARPGGNERAACADLTGRYAIADGVLGRVFPRPNGPKDHGIYWHTLEITHNDSREPVLLFYGRGLDDDRAAPAHTRTSPLRWTRCREGWLLRELGAQEGEPVARAAGDHRTIERYVLVAADSAGNLVAQEVIERYQTVSFWAPGGADVRVPLTGSADRRWSRWLAATDDPTQPRLHPLAESSAPALRTLGRRLPPDAQIVSQRDEGGGHVLDVLFANASGAVEIEEQLRSSGDFGEAEVLQSRQQAGGVVVTLRIGPPLAKRADDAAQRAARVAQREQTEAMVRRLLPLLPKGAALANAAPNDDGYLLEIRCPDDDALSVLMGRLRDSPDFGIPELRSTAPYVRPQVTATIWVRAR